MLKRFGKNRQEYHSGTVASNKKDAMKGVARVRKMGYGVRVTKNKEGYRTWVSLNFLKGNIK